MPPFLDRDHECRLHSLTRLTTGHIIKSLWLSPDQAESMNDSPILLLRGLRWIEEGQLNVFGLAPIDHDSFFTCTPQNKCRK